MSVQIHPSVFSGPGREGDFAWMIAQERYRSAFFIFNDNQEQFLAFQADPSARSGPGCTAGGGNAAIRPWQCADPPRAGGIPTGGREVAGGPGYPALTGEVKAVVDQAVAFIAARIAEHGFTDVYFSSDGKGSLGHGIFDPAPDVKAYIVERIQGLADRG